MRLNHGNAVILQVIVDVNRPYTIVLILRFMHSLLEVSIELQHLKQRGMMLVTAFGDFP